MRVTRSTHAGFDRVVERIVCAQRGQQQQHAPVAHAQMKTVARVDRHRHRRGQRVCRNGDRDLAAQRRDRQVRAGEPGDSRGPRAGGVHDGVGRNLLARGSHRGDAAVAPVREPDDVRIPHEASAVAFRRTPVPVEDSERADEAVARAVRAAGDAVAADRRVQLCDRIAVHFDRVLDAVRTLHRQRRAEHAELAPRRTRAKDSRPARSRSRRPSRREIAAVSRARAATAAPRSRSRTAPETRRSRARCSRHPHAAHGRSPRRRARRARRDGTRRSRRSRHRRRSRRLRTASSPHAGRAHHTQRNVRALTAVPAIVQSTSSPIHAP